MDLKIVWIFGSIFYLYNVVGKNTYLMYTKMGGRTSLFLTSPRMPSRYVAYRCIYNYKNIIMLWM